jgi:hypothetical protein
MLSETPNRSGQEVFTRTVDEVERSMSYVVEQAIEVRVEGETVVIEPPEVYGVRGFEIRLTPARAHILGHALIGAATQAMPATVKTS